MRKFSILIIVFAFLACTNSFAQSAAGVGGLSGVVTDSSGATVPQAEVRIENQRLGIRRVLQTTGSGLFNAPALVPNSGYQVEINAPGFAQFEAKSINILVGQDVSINAVLQVKSSATQIEVNAPIVDTLKTDVSQDVTQHQIDNLPINGRRVDQFVLLTPAVVPDGTFGDLSFRGVPGGNTFLLDGNDTTDQFYDENSGRTRIPTSISQDAVQEFQVVTDAYSAEYGRALGGVINTVTRSGTNSLHGTAFWFFRNRTLDARDPLAGINPSEARHQFGGTISGPIVKNKLFYLFNTEEQRRDFPLISSLISPSAITGTGVNASWRNCGVASGGNPAATAGQCAAINSLLPAFFTTLPRTANQQTGFGKVDWRPTDLNSFSFSFNYQHFYSPNGIQTGAVVSSGGAFSGNGNDDVNVRNGRLAWTAVPTNRIVNEARFGWFKDRQSDAINSALINPNLGGPISLSVSGASIGFANYVPRIDPSESRFEYADNLSFTTGQHNFKFGVDYLDTEDYYSELNTGNGSYSYSNANAFALDFSGNLAGRRDYSSFTQAFGNRIVDTTIHEMDAYAQDQYRLRPNLTLYYGVRYEKNFLPQPLSQYVNIAYPQTGRIAQFNLDIAPRVGFAWSSDKDRTVVRGGYGIYYGRYVSALLNTLFTSNNNYQQSFTIQPLSPAAASPGPLFPVVLPNSNGLTASGLASIEFASPNLRTPYTEQADFSIQQQLNANTSLTLSYMWNRGAQFFSVRDINQPVLPPTLATYSVLNADGLTTQSLSLPVYLAANRLNHGYNHIYEVDNGGNTYYNGLSVQLQHRLAHNFEGSLSYTWSHAIDTNLGGGSNNLFFSGPSGTLLNGDYTGVKGSSSLDQRQRLVVNWIWSPVFTHSSSALARYSVNGWQLATITTVATGLPASETVNVQSNYPGLENNGYLTGFNGTNLVPFLGVNTLRLEPTTRLDARLSKRFFVTERFTATLQFEVFNLTNTATDTSINTVGYYGNWTGTAAAGHGILTPAPGLGTPNAYGGFPDGTNARRAQASIRLEF